MVCTVDMHACTCYAGLSLRDQESLAKSTWNLLLDTKRTDSDRDGIREYGCRDQEEIMKEG